MFTTSEFIAQHDLGVSPHDPRATRLISKRLKELGYRQRRIKREGKFQLVWTREPEIDYSGLEQKLLALT